MGRLLRQRILDPLQMKSTNFSDAESEKSPDYALPYTEVKGTVKRKRRIAEYHGYT